MTKCKHFIVLMTQLELQ